LDRHGDDAAGHVRGVRVAIALDDERGANTRLEPVLRFPQPDQRVAVSRCCRRGERERHRERENEKASTHAHSVTRAPRARLVEF
jgi:hypothetical protein